MDSANPDCANALGRARELARLRAQFPGFDIWLEEKQQLALFVARRQRDHLHPHTLVTTSPDEMRRQLAESTAESGLPSPAGPGPGRCWCPGSPVQWL